MDGYKLDCSQTDCSCYRTFAKFVRVDGSDEGLEKYYSNSDGLAIDVFPVDGALAPDKLAQKFRQFCVKVLRRVIFSRIKLRSELYTESCLRHLARRIFVAPFCLWSDRKLCCFANYLCKWKSDIKPTNYAMYGSAYSTSKENFSVDYWFPAAKLSLNGYEYAVPRRYEEMLTSIYGRDWREPPPDKLRHGHDNTLVL